MEQLKSTSIENQNTKLCTDFCINTLDKLAKKEELESYKMAQLSRATTLEMQRQVFADSEKIDRQCKCTRATSLTLEK